jgi:hypothetical protein
VEEIPTKFATNAIVIKFLEENILASFGCPRKIITENAQIFKLLAMIDFCQKFNIILGHSIAYYPQGNGLAESSNKSLMRVIKKVLTDNKRAWHSHLKFALWAKRINTKRSTGISPFQLIYDIDVVLPINIALSVLKLLQDSEDEPNDITRRMNQLIEVQQTREKVNENFQEYQYKIKVFLIKEQNKELLFWVT